MKTYKVNEIFYSLQGEGAWAGTPAVFIRFSGCNLQCPFCDTEHEMGKDMTLTEIYEEYDRLTGSRCNPPPIVLTGGEPMLQIDDDMVECLWGCGDTPIHLETNGTMGVSQSIMSKLACITVSPKLPPDFSQPLIQQLIIHNRYGGMAELKIVYDNQNTLLCNLIESWIRVPFSHRYIQPCDYGQGKTSIEEALQFVREHPKWTLSVQLQKLLNIR